MHPQAAAFEQTLALHCAPALTGVAPANLVSLSLTEHPSLAGLLTTYDRGLSAVGIRLLPLCRCRRRVLLLVYRPELLEERLAPPAVRRFLERCGYPVEDGLDAMILELRRRVSGGDGFPHEVGLFLGYPLADVLGFLALGGDGCRLCGYWKVYGDVEYAKRCFRRFDRSRETLCRGLRSGRRLLWLLGAVPRKAA